MTEPKPKFEVGDLVKMPKKCEGNQYDSPCPFARHVVPIIKVVGDVYVVQLPKEILCEFRKEVCGEKKTFNTCWMLGDQIKLVKRLDKTNTKLDQFVT